LHPAVAAVKRVATGVGTRVAAAIGKALAPAHPTRAPGTHAAGTVDPTPAAVAWVGLWVDADAGAVAESLPTSADPPTADLEVDVAGAGAGVVAGTGRAELPAAAGLIAPAAMDGRGRRIDAGDPAQGLGVGAVLDTRRSRRARLSSQPRNIGPGTPAVADFYGRTRQIRRARRVRFAPAAGKCDSVVAFARKSRERGRSRTFFGPLR
jgi:hypothetical protein